MKLTSNRPEGGRGPLFIIVLAFKGEGFSSHRPLPGGVNCLFVVVLLF